MKSVVKFFISIIIVSTLVLAATIAGIIGDNLETRAIAYLQNLNILESYEDLSDVAAGLISSGSEDNSALVNSLAGEQCPYYDMLDENEKEVYLQAYKSAVNLDLSFAPEYVVYENDLEDVMSALFYDHPELFYLQTSYSYEVYSSGRCGAVNLEYNECAYNLQECQRLFDDAVNDIAANAMSYPSNYAREKYVHDKIVSTVDYNLDASLSQSAYSALVNHSTVCTGYAKAFQVVMNKLGIPTYLCIGDSEGTHAWNIVKLDDGYYNVDLTWDDQWIIIYNFFNCSDEDFSNSHTRTGLSVNLPSCNGSAYRALEEIYSNIIYIPGTPQEIPVPKYDDRPVMIVPTTPDSQEFAPDNQEFTPDNQEFVPDYQVPPPQPPIFDNNQPPDFIPPADSGGNIVFPGHPD